MRKKSDMEWVHEKKAMQTKYDAVMKKRIPIRDVPDEVDAIAYTTDEPAIYLKKNSSFTKTLDDRKARVFRFGLFTREMLRQHFTNYKYQKEIAETLEAYEVPIFKTICGIIEGAVMDAVAPALIGGYLLNSLRYTSKVLHDGMAEIESAKTPFQEFILAMEQVAEIGTRKGDFITPAAKTVYYRSHINILDAVEEADDRKRVDLCLEIHKKSKPIWEADARRNYDRLSAAENLEAMLGSSAKWLSGGALSSGSGSGVADPSEITTSIDYTKGGYRETAYHDVSDLSEEEQEAYRESKKQHEEMRANILSDLDEDEDDEDDSISYSNNGEGNDKAEMFFDRTEDVDLSTIYDYDPEEDEIDVKGCDFFDDLIQIELEQERREDLAASATALKAPLDLPEVAKKYSARNYKCKNLVARLSDKSTAYDGYNKVVINHEGLIVNAFNRLKTMFAEESEETIYRSSGKLSLKKSMSGTVSSKMFTKKVDPTDKSNMAVMLAIDESGSMSGSRIVSAKTTAICLAEIFKRLGIPLYIMGYTADTGGADALHIHYTMWSGATDDLLKLTSIEAKASNFDGYSVRYASNILDKRTENHKVLIVISDGQPACSAYYSADGLMDTRDAIAEARGREQTVLGVAIGADELALQDMYGNDFIYVTDTRELFSDLINKFTSIVASW